MTHSKKQILITGASRGIGRELALIYAKAGNHVIITARSDEKLREIQSKYPENITAVTADLLTSNGINAITDAVKKKPTKTDILINNAGVLINKPFMETSDSDWQTQLDCNLMAAVRLTRAMVPLMISGGHILNISSMGGYQGSSKFPGLCGYSVAKGGLTILSECLAVELAEYQISVNCLCLGAVQTEMLEQAFPGLNAPISPTEMGEFITNFALTGQKFFNGKVLPVSLTDPT